MVSFWLIALSLCFVLSLKEVVNATKGVDLSTSASKGAFTCLKEEGYEFVIVRAYRSLGEPDPSAAINLANAKAAGIENADVYMFPCPKCSKSAKEQVDEMSKWFTLKSTSNKFWKQKSEACVPHFVLVH